MVVHKTAPSNDAHLRGHKQSHNAIKIQIRMSMPCTNKSDFRTRMHPCMCTKEQRCTCGCKQQSAIFILVESQQGEIAKGQGANHAEHAVPTVMQESLHLMLVTVGFVRGHDAICRPLPAPP